MECCGPNVVPARHVDILVSSAAPPRSVVLCSGDKSQTNRAIGAAREGHLDGTAEQGVSGCV